MNKQTELFKVKSKKKRSASRGRIGRNYFRRWIARQPLELNYYKIIKIIKKYEHWKRDYCHAIERRKSTRPHRIKRISKRKIQSAVNAVVNHVHGKDNRTIDKIADDFNVGRSTLFRYYRKWRKNPNRANRTPLFTNHVPKSKSNNH